MLASLLLAAAAPLEPVIADPRRGESRWAVVSEAGPLPDSAVAGALVELPAAPREPDQRWLERLVELAARGPVVAVGAAAPPAAVLPYLDGVAIDPGPPLDEVQALSARLAGVPLVLAAADAEHAVALLAAGADAVLLGEPDPGWAAEVAELLPEPAPATWAGRGLATALRGGDLATVVGLPAGFAGGDVRLADTWYGEARVVAGGAHVARLVVAPGGATVAVPRLPRGGLLVALRPVDGGRAVDRVEVTGEAAPSVAEVVARHQRAAARQERALVRWKARQRLTVRVWVGDLGRTFELVLAGPAFHARGAGTDWEVAEAWIDGVARDPAALPELPLLEPQRPPVPPFALRLAPAWEYRLAGVEVRDGRRCYTVAFFSRSGERPERRGRAWIAADTYALVALEERVTGLEGEVVASSSATTFAQLAIGATPVWLPRSVEAEDLVAAFGGTAIVRRALAIEDVVLDPPGLEAERARAWAGARPMFRDASPGLVPLVPDGRGGRVPGGIETPRQAFLLGGVVADPGLSVPLPYGGVHLQDFDFRGRGEQLRAFLAGVVNDAAWSRRRGRLELSLRAFVQLVAFDQQAWVGGEERDGEQLTVRRQRLGGALATTAGPVRFELDLGCDRWDFAAGGDTSADFQVPSDTWEGQAAFEAAVVWRGVTVTATAEAGRRFAWAPWGPAAEPEVGGRNWQRYHLTVAGESAPMPLTRLGLEAQLWGGDGLDRFSAPAPGRFGAVRLRGIASSRVAPDRLALVRGVVAAPLGARARAEVGVDLAWVDERRSGYRARPLSGVGLGASLAGPWGTMVQLGVGFPLATPGPRGATFELFLLRPLSRVYSAP